MSKYLKVYWDDRRQWKSTLYRIYLNLVIFLRIPIAPLAIDRKCFEFWWKGDSIFYLWKWARKKGDDKPYISLLSEGSFKSLKELDQFWDGYFEEERKFSERMNAESIYREANGLYNEPFCQIEGEHKKH